MFLLDSNIIIYYADKQYDCLIEKLKVHNPFED
jgi:predicted nucleic acid-binding protein